MDPKCAYCKGNSFRVRNMTDPESQRVFTLLSCGACGAIAGVVEAGRASDDLLQAVAARVAAIDRTLIDLQRGLARQGLM